MPENSPLNGPGQRLGDGSRTATVPNPPPQKNQGQTATHQITQEGSIFGSRIKLGKGAKSTSGNTVDGIPVSMTVSQGASTFNADIEGDESAQVEEGNKVNVAASKDEGAKQ